MRKPIPLMIGRAGEFLGDSQAATATEYAVMLAMIILAAFGAIQTYGASLGTLFGNIENTLFAGS